MFSKAQHSQQTPLTKATTPFFKPEPTFKPLATEPQAVAERAPESVMRLPIQAKLTVGQPNDKYEQEADAMADKVVRRFAMPTSARFQTSPTFNVALPNITPFNINAAQRACAACEKEDHDHIQRKESGEMTASPSVESRLSATKGSGSSLSDATRTQMESAIGADFSNVRVHTGGEAVQLSQDLSAHAFTHGSDVYFNSGKFAPDTEGGRHLLAHELTHTVQQGSGKLSVQRSQIRGEDHGGVYRIDAESCQFRYNQDWYFTFPTAMTPERRQEYMRNGATQVHDIWSNKFPIKPLNTDCPCQEGVSVDVSIDAKDEARGSRHGYTIAVANDEARGWTNQPNRNIDLDDTHDAPSLHQGGISQHVIAHEFGHTLGLTDEYHWWAGLFGTAGHSDPEAIMNTGDTIRPRHYQPFADIMNHAREGCNYQPNGQSTEYEVPNELQTSLPAPQSSAFGRSYQRRATNAAWGGLVYPYAGLTTFGTSLTGNTMVGGDVGLRLNQIIHPLDVGLRAGLAVNPQSPSSLPLPYAIADLGLRSAGGSVGARYMVTQDSTTREPTHFLGLAGTW